MTTQAARIQALEERVKHLEEQERNRARQYRQIMSNLQIVVPWPTCTVCNARVHPDNHWHPDGVPFDLVETQIPQRWET